MKKKSVNVEVTPMMRDLINNSTRICYRGLGNSMQLLENGREAYALALAVILNLIVSASAMKKPGKGQTRSEQMEETIGEIVTISKLMDEEMIKAAHSKACGL